MASRHDETESNSGFFLTETMTCGIAGIPTAASSEVSRQLLRSPVCVTAFSRPYLTISCLR